MFYVEDNDKLIPYSINNVYIAVLHSDTLFDLVNLGDIVSKYERKIFYGYDNQKELQALKTKIDDQIIIIILFY